jgi:tRNA(adenine34) deaminase
MVTRAPDGGDRVYLRAAIDCALSAEGHGNLPIGSVIVLGDRIVARGENGMFSPRYAPLHHAETHAIYALDGALLKVHSRELTLYTTLEPCPMCFGAATVARIGRVVFGTADPEGGARTLLRPDSNIYSAEALPDLEESSALTTECAALYERARAAFHAYSRSD